MGCQRCLKRRNIKRSLPYNTTEQSIEVEFPIVYVVCRKCGTLRAMRFNLATQFVKQECEQCNHKIFHVLKTTPSPEVLKRLIIK